MNITHKYGLWEVALYHRNSQIMVKTNILQKAGGVFCRVISCYTP